MNKFKFEIKYDTCKICNLVFLGEKENHLNSNEYCKVLQKKRDEEYKIFFDNWQETVDALNFVIKRILKLKLDEEDASRINYENLSFEDDEKDYKDDEDHEMIVNMYGITFTKFSSYKREREIFKRFNRERNLFEFEIEKKKLIGIEKCRLTDTFYKMSPEQEIQLWREFEDTTLILVEKEVEKEMGPSDDFIKYMNRKKLNEKKNKL